MRSAFFQVETRIECSSSSIGYKEDVTMMDSDIDSDYIFDVCISDTSYIISLSNMNIQKYDSTTNTLVSQFSAHRDRINSIEVSKKNPYLLLSASSDKCVSCWDLRSSQSICTMTLPDEVFSASLGAGDSLIAAAFDKSVGFYDMRMLFNGSSDSSNKKGKRIGEYADAHTDLVTQVKFHPLNPTQLVSAAEDGLICLFDTSVPEEDEAIISVLNTDCPVRRFGFFGSGLEGLYCLSTTEVASFWHTSSAQRLSHFPDVRQELNVDYLVDCMYNSASDSLILMAGDYQGRGVVAHVRPSALSLGAPFSLGHAATIRCVTSLDNASNNEATGVQRFITGGEDGALITWNLAAGDIGDGGGDRGASSSHSRQKKSVSLRNTPY